MLRTMIAAACAMSAAAFLAHVPEAGAQAGGSSAGSAPVYTPPQRGAPSRRVGGSSRGAGDALPAVMILAPDHVGLTTSESPSLYWYLSKPTTVRVEVTLVDEKGETPLIEYAIEKVQVGRELLGRRHGPERCDDLREIGDRHADPARPIRPTRGAALPQRMYRLRSSSLTRLPR